MTDYRTARQAIVNKSFIKSPKFYEQQTRADKSFCHNGILEFEKAFISKMHKMHIPVFTHCARRTAVEQDRLYKAGRSKAKAGESPHNHGMAVDIIHGIHAWDIHRKSWDLFGHIGKEIATQKGIKITWGGDWNFYDPAHWELTDWRIYKDQACLHHDL